MLIPPCIFGGGTGTGMPGAGVHIGPTFVYSTTVCRFANGGKDDAGGKGASGGGGGGGATVAYC